MPKVGLTDAEAETRRVAVAVGPEHATVGPDHVEEAAKEAMHGAGFDLLVVLGSGFDPHAGETAKEFAPQGRPTGEGLSTSPSRPNGTQTPLVDAGTSMTSRYAPTARTIASSLSLCDRTTGTVGSAHRGQAVRRSVRGRSGDGVDLTGRYSNPRDPLRRLAELELCADNARGEATSSRAVAGQPRFQRRLTPEDRAKLVAARETGATVRELAEQFGIHRTTVAPHLQREA